jgi:hypothetical protein
MVSEKEIVLYYPYIDIDDASLIKTAALYWDEIQTIAPLEMEGLHNVLDAPSRLYSGGISKEAKDVGLLKPRWVDSEDESVKIAGRELLNDIRMNPEVLEDVAQELKRPSSQRRGDRPKHIRLYMDKMNPNHLLHLGLELSKYNIPLSPLGEDSIAMPTQLHDPYMSRLASVISEADGSVPLTNEKFWQSAMLGRYVNYSQERAENQAKLVTMSLDTISIDPDVPLKKVLEFREKHRDKLLALRREIRALVRSISKGLDDSEKQKVFEEILRDRIIPSREVIQTELRETDIGFVWRCIEIAAVTDVGIVTTQEFITCLVTAGLLMGFALGRNLRDNRLTVSNDPLGYLYQARKEFEKS